jgi:Redoxin
MGDPPSPLLPGHEAWTYRPGMKTAVVFEESVATLEGEAAGDDLWVAAPELRRALGWELRTEGLCRGALCVPVPPARRAEFVRTDCAVNLGALARHRGQPVVHDASGTAWVCGRPGELRAATGSSLLAPDFTLPDLDGTPHTLSAFRGRKVLLNSWASW